MSIYIVPSSHLGLLQAIYMILQKAEDPDATFTMSPASTIPPPVLSPELDSPADPEPADPDPSS